MRINRIITGRRVALIGSVALTLAADESRLAAQPRSLQPTLSLTDALREADQHAFANRQAALTVSAERAQARVPLKGVLPSARMEVGVVRTSDPLAAFGSTLRQRQVTTAAFDPARLNDPAAISNVGSGLIIEVPVFNADALAATRAARAAAGAASAANEWTILSTRAGVVRGFYAAVLASQKAASLEIAQGAAEAAVRQVRAMTAQGVVTKADALQAEVRAADIMSQLLAARDDARTAVQQLGLLLGRTVLADIRVPAELPDVATVRALAVRDTLMSASNSGNESAARADLRAARAGVEAANANHLRARGTLVPRVNSFARYDWNSAQSVAGGRKSWTVGVVGSWALFSGGSELADVARAAAHAGNAVAAEEAKLAQVQFEESTARRGLSTALVRLDLAERVADQSREAHRLVEKRYAGGLATMAELLGAEATARAGVLGLAVARYAVIEAVVAHRHAIGADPSALSTLDSSP